MFPCIKCGSPTKTLYTAGYGMKPAARRRRACTDPACMHRFTTIERPQKDDVAEIETNHTNQILALLAQGYIPKMVSTKLELPLDYVYALLRKHRQRGEPDQSPHPKEPSS